MEPLSEEEDKDEGWTRYINWMIEVVFRAILPYGGVFAVADDPATASSHHPCSGSKCAAKRPGSRLFGLL